MFLTLDNIMKNAVDITKLSNKLLEKEKKETDNIDSSTEFEDNETSKKYKSLKTIIANMKSIKYDIAENLRTINENTKGLMSDIHNEIFERNPLEFLELYVPALTQVFEYVKEKLIPHVKLIVSKTVGGIWYVLKPLAFAIRDKISSFFKTSISKTLSFFNITVFKRKKKKEEVVAESIYDTLKNLNFVMGAVSNFMGGGEGKLKNFLSSPMAMSFLSSITAKAYVGMVNKKKINEEDKTINKVKSFISNVFTNMKKSYTKAVIAERERRRELKTSDIDEYNRINNVSKIKSSKSIEGNIETKEEVVNEKSNILRKSSTIINDFTDNINFKIKKFVDMLKTQKQKTISKMKYFDLDEFIEEGAIKILDTLKTSLKKAKRKNIINNIKDFSINKAISFKENISKSINEKTTYGKIKTKEFITSSKKRLEIFGKKITSKKTYDDLFAKFKIKTYEIKHRFRQSFKSGKIQFEAKMKSIKSTISSLKAPTIKETIGRTIAFVKSKSVSACNVFDDFVKGLLKLLALPFLLAFQKFKTAATSRLIYLIRLFRVLFKRMLRKMSKFIKFLYRNYIRRPIRKLIALVKWRIIRPIKNFARRLRKWFVRALKFLAGKFIDIFKNVVIKTASTSIFQSIKGFFVMMLKKALKPVISFFIKTFAGLMNFIPIPGIGTAISIGLFALDLKYDISGQIVDFIFDLPSTIGKVFDGMKAAFEEFVIVLKDIVDSLLTPFINIFEILRTVFSLFTGGLYSITLRPIFNILSKVSGVFGFDSFSNTIENINKSILEFLRHDPKFASDMNFDEKLSYFPNLILNPIKQSIDLIKNLFAKTEEGEASINASQPNMGGSSSPIAGASSPMTQSDSSTVSSPSAQSNTNGMTLPTSSSQGSTVTSTGSSTSKENNVTNEIKTNNNQTVTNATTPQSDQTSQSGTSTNASGSSQSGKRENATKGQVVPTKPVQDPVRIKNIVGYKLVFEQYF